MTETLQIKGHENMLDEDQGKTDVVLLRTKSEQSKARVTHKNTTVREKNQIEAKFKKSPMKP